MPFRRTTATRKLQRLTKRIRGVQGGTSASKTISILLILIDKYQTKFDRNRLGSITSESFPHLKRGALRDFKNIMTEHKYWDDARWNATDYIYTFETGNKLEFFSLDQPHKVRGPRRDDLFINEANNVKKETFEQLEVRTRDTIWLDWNPTQEFWFHLDLVGRDDVEMVILTYKDNEGLPIEIVRSIEARRGNRPWWRVYGEGLVGEVEGRIYTGWKIIDEVPHEARLERRGLDFGYSADPAALVAAYFYNGGYVLDEEMYRTGMQNKAIGDVINAQPRPGTLVAGDSAEPKSIDELKLYGINIVPTQKGPGSLLQGIQYVQGLQISVTKRSLNLIKEFRTYMWKFDKDGRQLAVPEPGNDHALDAARYALENLRPIGKVEVYVPDWVQRKQNQW